MQASNDQLPCPAPFFRQCHELGMIRAEGRPDCIGAMEVADNGDIANWKIPKKMVKGMAALWTL